MDGQNSCTGNDFWFILKLFWNILQWGIISLDMHLNHLPLNKMAAISQTTFSSAFKVSLKFIPNGPIDNKSALVQVMAWRRTGDKPLPEPMLTQFTDTYMRH